MHWLIDVDEFLCVGDWVVLLDGDVVGKCVGRVGTRDGDLTGDRVGNLVGDTVGENNCA